MVLDDLFMDVNGQRRPSHQALAKLSGLSDSQLADFRRAWASLGRDARVRVARSLVDLAEDNVELDYINLCKSILDDPDPGVRAIAIEGLWEDDRRSTADTLLRVGLSDPDETVRAAAITSLGRWVLDIELGNTEGPWADRLAGAMLTIAESAEIAPGVRRRAVEAAGFLNSPRTTAVIRNAYAHPDSKMRASALFAMGRNSDSEWFPILVQELTSELAELRFEAARALGELEDGRAVSALVTAARDPDREVRFAAVSSLGKVGGRVARQALISLRHDAKDGAFRTAVDAAIEELTTLEDPMGVRVGEISLN